MIFPMIYVVQTKKKNRITESANISKQIESGTVSRR